MIQREKIGIILIKNGILSPKTAARIIALSKQHNKRFGWILENLKLVTGKELAAALAAQYNLKMASDLDKYTFSPDLLHLITCEVALQNLIFPLKLDNGNLLLAVADPTDLKIVDHLTARCGLHITPCVSTRSDIYAAICKHYLNVTVGEPDKDTVLIIENDQSLRESIKNVLTKARYTVLVANDGVDGFSKIISEKPHVVLTGKALPKLDGLSLMKCIKSVPDVQSIPVILMSKEISPEEEACLFDTGFYDYIPKPINNQRLELTVKRAFRFNGQKYGLF